MIFVVPLFIVLAVAAIVYGIYQSQQRQQALRKLAARLGWEFYPKHSREMQQAGWFESFSDSVSGDYTDKPIYTRFGVFTRGGDRTPYNTLRGKRPLALAGGAATDCPVLAGDFSYRTGGGRNRTTHRFSYLLVRLPGVTRPLPETVVRPEGFMDSISGLFGFDDIDFESVEFSDAFHVAGDDKRFAYDLMDPRMMQFLLDTRPPRVEIEGRHLCLGGGDATWTPREFEQRLRWLESFLERWPRQLVGRI